MWECMKNVMNCKAFHICYFCKYALFLWRVSGTVITCECENNLEDQSHKGKIYCE